MRKGVKEFYEGRARFISGRVVKEEADRRNNKLDTLLRMIDKKKYERNLEIGCGSGSYLKNISKRLNVRESVSIDISKIFASHEFSYLIRDADEEDLPFKKETFDLVLLLDVIEHLFDPDHILDEIRRVLKWGGYVIITTPNLASWYNRVCLLMGWQTFWTEVSTKFVIGNPLREKRAGCLMPSGHLRVFTPVALKRLVEKHGFSIEMLEGYPPKENFGLIFGLIERIFHRSKLASFIVVKAMKR